MSLNDIERRNKLDSMENAALRYGSRRELIFRLISDLIADESGQATTEYVLLLAVLAGIILTVGTAFRKKLKTLIEGRVGNYIFAQFFDPGRLHKFSLGISK